MSELESKELERVTGGSSIPTPERMYLQGYWQLLAGLNTPRQQEP